MCKMDNQSPPQQNGHQNENNIATGMNWLNINNGHSNGNVSNHSLEHEVEELFRRFYWRQEWGIILDQALMLYESLPLLQQIATKTKDTVEEELDAIRSALEFEAEQNRTSN